MTQTGAPLVMLDGPEDGPMATAQSVMALGLRTVFAVPLLAGDAVLGVLYLDSQRVLDPDPTAGQTLMAFGALAGALLAR